MDTESISQATADQKNPSAVVRKIAAPGYLWAALEAIAAAPNVRNAVLIVFSPQVHGRIGVFCNRFISGAALDGSTQTGMAAVQALLAATSGISGFRPCLPAEGEELKQDLCIDINELLATRAAGDANRTPSDALLNASLAGPVEAVHLHFSEAGAEMLNRGEQLGDMPLILESPEDRSIESAGQSVSQGAKSQAEQPSAGQDQAAAAAESLAAPQVTDAWNALAQVLSPTAPKAAAAPEVGSGAIASSANNLHDYKTLVEQELGKLNQFIEQSARKEQDVGAHEKSLMEDLRLFDDMLHAEQARVNNWAAASLDAIPTPTSRTVAEPLGSAKLSPYALACNDLISLSSARVYPGKGFVKPKSDLDDAPGAMKDFWGHRRNVLAVYSAVLIALIGLVCFVCWEARRRDLMQAAVAQLNAGKPGAALVYLTSAVEHAPGYAPAYYLRGIALAATDQPQAAIDSLNQAAALGEPKSHVLAALAAVELDRHKYEAAMQDATMAAMSDYKNVDAYKVRALCYSHQGDFENAIKDLSQALALSKDKSVRARLLRERGFAYCKTHDWAAATQDLTNALAVVPSSWVYMQRGDAYRLQRKFEAACADYTKAIALQPDFQPALTARGICELNLHKDDDALTDFESCLKLNPANVEALIRRGSVYLDKSQFRPAADDFEQAVALNPYISEAQDKLSIAYHHLQKSQQPRAIALVEVPPAQIKLPADLASLMNLGYKYMNDGAYDEAIMCFAAAVTKEPSNPEPRKYLAYAFSARGDFADAASQLQALKRLRSLDDKEGLLLARCLRDCGQRERAIAILMPMLLANPNNLVAEAELSRLYMDGGFPDKANDLKRDGLSKARTPSDRQLFETGPVSNPAGGGSPGPASSP